jgi:hypothetical protein
MVLLKNLLSFTGQAKYWLMIKRCLDIIDINLLLSIIINLSFIDIEIKL